MIKVGLIGLGKQTIEDHLPALLQRNDIQIDSMCDIDPEKQSSFQQCYSSKKSIPFFQDYRQMIEKRELELAIVSVPHNAYVPIIQLLAKNNIHIMKEKPIARSIDELLLMSSPEIRKNCFICSQRRFNPLYAYMHNEMKQIGEPYLFQGTYLLNIEDPSEGWRGSRKVAGGGCLLDMGYHLIDQLTWFFGEPKKLFCSISTKSKPYKTYDAEDSATVAFNYESGMHGTLLISRHAGEKKEEYLIVGPKGTFKGDKNTLSHKDFSGNTLNSLTNTENMIDNQLDFVIEKIKKRETFEEVFNNHIKNIKFIDRCYDSAGYLI